MATLETLPEVTKSTMPAMVDVEPLFDLQLQVARRADAIARRQMIKTRELDRHVWLRAELEIFERNDRMYATPVSPSKSVTCDAQVTAA